MRSDNYIAKAENAETSVVAPVGIGEPAIEADAAVELE